jgi:hypothetical protein
MPPGGLIVASSRFLPILQTSQNSFQKPLKFKPKSVSRTLAHEFENNAEIKPKSMAKILQFFSISRC